MLNNLLDTLARNPSVSSDSAKPVQGNGWMTGHGEIDRFSAKFGHFDVL